MIPKSLSYAKHYPTFALSLCFQFLILFFTVTVIDAQTPPPPVAQDDNYTVHYSITFDVSLNDSNLGGVPQAYIVSPPSNGNLGGPSYFRFSYSPHYGFTGTDSFTYKLCRPGNVCSGIATVTLTVVNEAPVAVDDWVLIKAPLTRFLYLKNDYDPDGDSFSSGGYNSPLPQKGNLGERNFGDSDYHVLPNTSGYDSWGYNLRDSLGLTSSGIGTVSFLIIPQDGAESAGTFCPMKGRPVNPTNGNMWVEQKDYVLPGTSENIIINRFYNSVIQTTGLFGLGWSTKYDESLWLYDDKMLRLNMPDGRAVYFGRKNLTDPFEVVSPEIFGQIVKNPDYSYDLTFKDGRIHKFDATGKLLWKKDKNGNQTNLNYDANGFLTGITDSFGRTLTIKIGTNGAVSQLSDSIGTVASYEYYPGTTQLKTVTYPDGSKYKFEYTTVGTKTYLATVKDAFDNILETHQYDSQGRALTSEVQGGVEKYTFDYTHANDIIPYTSVTDALGRVTKFTFDKSKGRNVVVKTEGVCSCGGSGSEITNFEYDDKLNLTKKTDALGHQTTYTYDNNGNRLTQTDLLGTQTYTYNSFGEVLIYTDQMGGVTTNTYDTAGNLLTTKDALNNTTTLTYTALGQLTTIQDALNHTTTLTYDTSGRLTQVTDANNKTTNFGYDARARVTSTTNALNETTSFEYDLNNRLKKVTYPDTNFVTFAHDLAGRRTGMTDARNNTTTYAYDGAYRLTGVTDALNHARTFGYDLMSNLTSQTDALGNTTDYEYDDFNRINKVIYPPASVGATRLEESLAYDTVGNVKTRTDTAGRQTLYDYDTANRLTKTTDALNNATQFEYNARSQMTKVTDALNQQYTFTYDPLGRTLSQTRASSTMSFEYDAVGNRTKRTDYANRVTTYQYDNLNRLTQGGRGIYTYDDLSRMLTAVNDAGTVSFTYDNRSRVKTTTDVFNHVIEYGYDANGNRNLLKLDGVNYAVYAYDAANRLAAITNSADSTDIGFGYDIADRLTSRTYPNGVNTTYEYDGMSRQTRLKDVNPTTTLLDRQYSYNAANQISQIIEPTRIRTFGYDNVDRLTSATDSQYGNESYAYDAVGNRTSSHRSSTYTYQPYNRLTSTDTASYSYDANGTLSLKHDSNGDLNFSYDYENQLTMAYMFSGARIVTNQYKYDALGRMVWADPSDLSPSNYTYDGQDVLVQNYWGADMKYQNGPGIDNRLAVLGVMASDWNYLLKDHLGSLSNDGTTPDSFGNPVTGGYSDFTGRGGIDNLTGLIYFRARWYDPNLGRFISEDPIGFGGGDINLFGYVKNNSINRKDPLGLWDPGDGEALRQALKLTAGAGGSAAIYGGLAYGGVAIGGFGLGYAIGYYPGQWTARYFYPDQFPDTQTTPQPMPQASSKPTCQAAPSSKPFWRFSPLPVPFSSPDDDDDNKEDTCSRLAALCLRKPWLPPGSPFGRRKDCGACARACRANGGAWDFEKCPISY